jgi:steroid 5-alpha reductase family enzyme
MTGYIILGLGVLFYAIGFLFEALGDYQLKVFKRDPKNKGKIMDKGLWSLTRHPNYFGDFMIWFGYSVMMLSSINMNYLYTVIGFLIMAFLLRFVSGVPLLEKKYKDNALYQAYAKKTPIFFPKLFK